MSKKANLWIFFTAAWVVLIFILATSPFSARNMALRFPSRLIFDLRVWAHVAVYLILGFLISGTIRSRYKGKFGPLLALLIGFAIAALDELHQYLEPGRRGRMHDVLINWWSCLAGVLLHFILFIRLYKKEKLSKMPESSP